MTVVDIDTPHGLARANLRPTPEPRAALVLGHGAAGGIEAPDIQAAAQAAESEDFAVALVEQPYRVAGRRSPASATQLDAAWITVLERLRAGELAGLPLVVGGRSTDDRGNLAAAHRSCNARKGASLALGWPQRTR